ncbi:MAG: hypothetical protein IPK26_00495 [Planctomycetes bacterium]|nr:hypothetical protein [Planctomycetota bacterium]
MRTCTTILAASTLLATLPAQDNQATFARYGVGCPRGLTAYETFSATRAFDLSFDSICYIPSGQGYTVVRGPGFENTYMNAVPQGNDGNQGFLFPAGGFPFGGQTFTDGAMVSNGFVWLGGAPAVNPNAPVASAAALVAGQPRIAPFWCDLDPSAGGQCYLDVLNGFFWRVTLTWVAVPLAGSPGNLVSAQVIFEQNGVITMNWQQCATANSLTGISIGGGAPDAGPLDLSVRPFWIAGPTSSPALSLGALGSSLPVLGSTFQMQVTAIPPGTALGVLALGLNRLQTDVAALGLIGCTQYTSIDDQLPFVPTGSSHTLSLPIPASAIFLGVAIHSQAITFSPGFTALGVIASNGGRLGLGT